MVLPLARGVGNAATLHVAIASLLEELAIKTTFVLLADLTFVAVGKLAAILRAGLAWQRVPPALRNFATLVEPPLVVLVSHAATKVVDNVSSPMESVLHSFAVLNVVPILATKGRNAATRAVVIARPLDKGVLKNFVALLVESIPVL